MGNKFDYTSIEECVNAIRTLETLNLTSTEQYSDLLKLKEQLEKQGLDVDDEYIFQTLKAHSKFPYTQELTECITSTVNELLKEGEEAKKPVLLLGKIQCGKTNTFENIIGLSFDRGIEICIVLTKGTKALATQTLERMRKDFCYFEENNEVNQKKVVYIYDIIEDNLKNNGISEFEVSQDNTRHIIICKKEKKNLEYLISLFQETSPYLKSKKILVIDDEADFASRNYLKRKGNTSLAKVSSQIVELIKLPSYCRYLQVTATPYALYLQPDGSIELDDKGIVVPTFKPRYTALVPIHSKYVGGNQYFQLAQSPSSMFSHLFHKVAPKCIEVMGRRDKRYESNGIASKNILDLSIALISFIVSAAIRSIQEKKKGIIYKCSGLVHADIGRDEHEWQSILVNRILGQIGGAFCSEGGIESDKRVKEMFDNAYLDFQEANNKGRQEGLINELFPNKQEVIDKIIEFYKCKEYAVSIINSDNDVKAKLNKDGQLKLTHPINIFIGGSILDRGITIDKMLCFFYGRDPKKFQMDTVLQHARMYGARSMEDMAVTKFHTTEEIYNVFSKMNELDEQLRDWFVNHNQYEEDASDAVFVGYDKRIRPCAASKIKISNTLTIKPQLRILPKGFQTGFKTNISKTIEKIDTMIVSCPIDEKDNEFRLMDKSMAYDIIRMIRTTYDYNCDDNIGMNWNPNEFIGTIEYALDGTCSDKLYCLHRTNRNISRLRANGAFSDAPDDGHNDIIPSRNKAIDRPVLMLLRQNGEKNDGWRGAPFYWPVLIVPENIKPAIFTVDSEINNTEIDEINVDSLIKDIAMDDILYLKVSKEEFADIITENTNEVVKEVLKTSASRFLLRDFESELKYEIRTDVETDIDKISGINSKHDNIFPFKLRPYKYLLLRNSQDKSGSLLLVEINNPNPNNMYNESIHDSDIISDKANRKHEYIEDNMCNWFIVYSIKKIIGIKLNNQDRDSFNSIF